MATVFLFLSGFDPEEIIPSCFLGMYAALAALEAGLDFCMGCVMCVLGRGSRAGPWVHASSWRAGERDSAGAPVWPPVLRPSRTPRRRGPAPRHGFAAPRFGWMVKFKLLPPEVYSVGIATKPEAAYTYAEATKHLDLPEPERVCAAAATGSCQDTGVLALLACPARASRHAAAAPGSLAQVRVGYPGKPPSAVDIR